MGDQVLVKLSNKLDEKFRKVPLSRRELQSAQSLLRGDLVDCWDEKMVHDVTRGVPKANLEEFGEDMSYSLGLVGEQKQAIIGSLRKMKYSTSTESDILELYFELDQFRSVYGYMSSVREPDNTIAIAYAFHKLNFKMAPKTQLYIKKASFTPRYDIIEFGTRTQAVKFGEKDIDQVKNVYMRFKALDTLHREGIISAITYTD